jgi:DNA-binding beta-propeller fold protein YncE
MMAVKFDPNGKHLMNMGRVPEAINIPAPAAASPPPLRPWRRVVEARAAGRRCRAAAPVGVGVPGDNFNRPTDVGWDPQGNIFISDGYGNSRVAKFDKMGKYIKSWGQRGTAPGQFNTVHSLQVDAQGMVYVADRANNRIQVFDNDGNFKAQYRNVGSPWTLCITPGPHQYLYSSNSNYPNDFENGEIYKMELDGKILGKFSKAGKALKEHGSLHAMDCRLPNTLYTGDLTNWRVNLATATGHELTFRVAGDSSRLQWSSFRTGHCSFSITGFRPPIGPAPPTPVGMFLLASADALSITDAEPPSAFSRPSAVALTVTSVPDWLVELFARPDYLVVFAGVFLGLGLRARRGALLAGAAMARFGRLSLFWVIVTTTPRSRRQSRVPHQPLAGRGLAERHGWKIGLTRAQLAQFDRFFHRHGAKTVFIARFVTGLRVCCALLAGSSELGWKTFLLYNAMGAIVWSIAIAAAGYSLAYSWETLNKWIGRTGVIALVAVGLFAALMVARRRFVKSR